MKIINNIIVMIIFVFIVDSLHAKQVGKKTESVQPVIPVQPSFAEATEGRPIQPPMQVGSYARALETIRTKMRSDEVLKNNRFTPDFVKFVRDSVQGSEHADVFAKALLEAGAHLNVQFTGDNAIDATILTDIRDAIDRQMQTLFPKNMPTKPGKPIEQQWPVQGAMYVVPIDANTLRKYDLCPLFATRDKSKLNQEQQELVKEFKRQGYTEDEIASFITPTVSPHYSIFNEKSRKLSGEISPAFENKDVAVNVPCVVQLGRYGNWNRTLMQCKTLDQFELAERENLSPAMCGGLSLNNGRLIRNYALTGNEQSLSNMHNIPDAARFLRKLNIVDWPNAEELRDYIVRLNQELGVDGINVSAITTVSLFDSDLDKKPGFVVFNKEEFDYVQRVKTVIRDGLKQDNYIHIMIIGNEESVERLGHYFCFAIIKRGNEIQYIVLDTIPSAYHLQAGSHERDRLMFVIDNIEKGSSLINVTNLRVRFLVNK